MLMTEDDAKLTMCCRDRDYVCCGSRCAAWRWDVYANRLDKEDIFIAAGAYKKGPNSKEWAEAVKDCDEAREGWCGLAGTPIDAMTDDPFEEPPAAAPAPDDRLKRAVDVALNFLRDRADHADDTGSNAEMQCLSEIDAIMKGDAT
jgi:hypothetical protein